ncbi:putative reverse transcriptase zinc-binding domain-containing protein [Helianthus annuus]|nr:putative reverse transcriptase zinc-binding domain-containing protein [Helianthus annuus]
MFWRDWWISDDILQVKFPLLFSLEKNKSCVVADRLESVAQVLHYSWEWKRNNFNNEEQQEFEELLILLDGVFILSGEDVWSWTVGGSREFSVRNVKTCIFEAANELPVTSFEWCNWVPKKVVVVAWRAFLDRLPTADALLRRHIQTASQVCTICEMNVESVDHLFTGCPGFMEVWQVIFAWCHVPSVFAFHVRDLLRFHLTSWNGARVRKAFYGVILTTFWSIWKARNDFIFNQKEVLTRRIIDEIKVMSYLWITNRGRMSGMSWDAWGRFDSNRMG